MAQRRTTNEEQRPLLSPGNPVVPALSPESGRDDEPTSSSSSRHCLTSYVPIEPLLLGYTLSRVLIMGMTTYYFFDQASQMYGDPSMDSLNPCGHSHGHPKDKERAENVQKEFVQLAMISVFSDFITAVIPTMFIGPATDRCGRRIGFVLPLLGTCARAIVFLIVLGTNASFYYIYLGTVLEGLGGGFGTFLMATFSAAADVTSPGPQRGLRICVVEVVNILGSSAAGIAGGHWRQTGYVQPVMCAAALGVASLIYALWFLPETRRVQPDTTQGFSDANARNTGARLLDNTVVGAPERRKAVMTNYGAAEDARLYGGVDGSHVSQDAVMTPVGSVGINNGDLTGAGNQDNFASPNDDDDNGGLESSENSVNARVQSSSTHNYQSLCQLASEGSNRDSCAAPSRPDGSQRARHSNTSRSADRSGGRREGRGDGSTAPAPTCGESAAASGTCCGSAILMARKSWSVYSRPDDAAHPDRRRVLALCFFSFLLTVAVNFSKPSIEESFRMSDLCWNAIKDSEFSSAWLVAHWLCILLVLRVLQHGLHVHDVYLAMIGCVSGIAALFVFCFATLPTISNQAAEALVFASAGCGSLARALIPMLRSMSSSMVNKDEQGALFVSYACVELAGAAVFDMASGQIFKATVHIWPGIIFVIWILFLVVVMALLIKLAAVFRRQQPDSETGIQHQGIESETHRSPQN